MRILILTRSTYHHAKSGGLESQLKNLIEGLTELGYKITVLTTDLSTQTKQVLTDKGISFITKNNFILFTEKYNVPLKKDKNYVINYVIVKNTKPGKYPDTFLERAYKKLHILKPDNSNAFTNDYFLQSKNYLDKNQDNFDLIISQSTAARGILSTSIPIIAIIHGTILAEIKNRFSSNNTFSNWIRFFILDIPNWIIEKYTSNVLFFNKVSKVISVSTILQNQFLQEYPNLKDKTTVIYNGVDDTKFSKSKTKFNNFTCLYVGRIDREKGVDIIVSSASLIKSKNLKIDFKIIGSGVHLQEIKDQIKKLDVSDTIQLIPEIDNDQLPKYYQKSHLFVFPSKRQEGHPVTISEAFCTGLPVICSNGGGLAELIIDKVNGEHLELVNAKELAKKIEYYYNNKKELSILSEGAYKIGRSKYSKSSMALEYKKVIDNLSLK